ncbi:MAG: cadmium-translocating P-type ATPase [Erysipelotrichaceae bacterium]|nr:cadmium-translocating P-type ATPase [Erysipelotrichaceae bacterium]MDY5251782.1 heavy metal translocating P-type ATPase [Erysipelotrichaceae bacterium]
MKYNWLIEGLDCANCAAKIADKVSKIEGIKQCDLDFMSKTLSFETDELSKIHDQITKVIMDLEPDVRIIQAPAKTYHFSFDNIDCGHCAALIEQKMNKAPMIDEAHVDFVQKTGYFSTDDLEGALAVMTKLFNKKGGTYQLIENNQDYRLALAKDITATAAWEKIKAISKIENLKMDGTTLLYACNRYDHYMVHQEIMAILNADNLALQKEAHKKAQDEIKKQIIKIIVGIIILALSFMVGKYQALLLIVSYAILGYDVLYKAIRNIVKGNLFDENFLMSLASVMAIILQEHLEAVAVMLLYQIGEVFQDMAVANSRKSISELMDIKADKATILVDGQEITMFSEDVKLDDIVLIKPGQKVPVDGIITKGSTSLDTASLTGEAMYKDVSVNDEVISGCVNVSGAIEVKVTRSFEQSTVNKILELVEHASGSKAKTERFITKFAKVYTPIVVFMALGIVVLLPLFDIISLKAAIERACAFLVMSCPCALVISVPLGFFSGIGGLSKKGILLKGSNILEQLSTLEAVVFDKTGTLTTGQFYVAKIIGDEKGAALAAMAESYSTHPIAQSIVNYQQGKVDNTAISQVEEIAGEGLIATGTQGKIYVGNERLMKHFAISIPVIKETGTIVYVGLDEQFICALIIKDKIKDNSYDIIKQLKAEKIETLVVSGDVTNSVEEVANSLQIDKAYGQCLPADKAKIVQQLSAQKVTAFVGDGINDAPVLAMANVGFAMGALGSDAAIEASDVVIMDDDLTKIAVAIKQARKSLFIAKENIIFAIGVKLVVLLLGLFGFVSMWLAIFADVGVAMLCIINATRSYN